MKVQLNILEIGYASNSVARGLSAELVDGELTCLIGPNGAGKSTLMRTIAGFQKPLSGKVTIREEGGEECDITMLTPKQRARKVSVVLTERVELRNMTVWDMVAMGRAPYTGFWGKLNAADEDIVAQSIEDVGMSALANRMIQTLSDGERQKMMIAKAVAQQTPVILLDEPTAFLDYPSKGETLRMLRRLCHEQKKTILLSTHDLDVAMRLTDKVWFMNNGTITTGTIEDMKTDNRFMKFMK